MCKGVTRGLASKKFSGSVERLGMNRIIIINMESARANLKISLIE